MCLSVSFRRVVSTSADLERKVETVSLFTSSEDRDKVESILPQEQVAGVAKVSSIDERCVPVKRSNDTGGTAYLLVFIVCLHDDVFWVHKLVIVCLSCYFSDNIAELARVDGGVNTVSGPASYAIGYCDQVVRYSSGVFAPFMALFKVRVYEDACVKHIDLFR